MKKENKEKKFELPQLPPMPPLFHTGSDLRIQSRVDTPVHLPTKAKVDGLGDEVEAMLFDLKGEAVFVRKITDQEEVETWMRTELTAMLESAKQKNDEEWSKNFQTGLNRLSRFCK